MKNEEVKSYMYMVIKTIIPVIFYEIVKALKKIDIDIPVDQKFDDNLSEERHLIKKNIVKSSRKEQVKNEMGLSFAEKVFDINVVVSGETLYDINFEKFFNDNKNDDFWITLLNSMKAMLQAVVDGLNISVELSDDAQHILEDNAHKIESTLQIERFSYSSFKLFEETPTLEENDKYFILYRYRLINSIFLLENLLPTLELKQDDLTIISFKYFVRKWKALVITIVGNEIQSLNSDFSNTIQNDINEKISKCYPEFFKNNRKLRNNLHYSEIIQFQNSEYEIIEKYQDIYLDLIIDRIREVITIDINKECRRVTLFFKSCKERGLSLKDVNQFPYYYWVKFRLLGHV